MGTVLLFPSPCLFPCLFRNERTVAVLFFKKGLYIIIQGRVCPDFVPDLMYVGKISPKSMLPGTIFQYEVDFFIIFKKRISVTFSLNFLDFGPDIPEYLFRILQFAVGCEVSDQLPGVRFVLPDHGSGIIDKNCFQHLFSPAFQDD